MEILRAINDLRERYDLAPLGKNTEMMKIARVRAEEIASGREPESHFHHGGERGYTEGQNPDEERRGEVLFKGWTSIYKGKILQGKKPDGLFLVDNQEDARRVVGDWEKSPSHKKVLLDIAMRTAGFGLASQDNSTFVFVVAILSSKIE